jgi:hypothetical protein
MSQKGSEVGARALAASVRELVVKDEDGNAVGSDAVLRLVKAHVLHFRLEFASQPTRNRYRVTLVIHRRGRGSPVSSGEIRNADHATTFTQFVNVQNSPPRLEFDVVHRDPHRFHAGPGPYETTIALTPTDSAGNPDEEDTSSMAYDFVAI